MPEHCGHGFYNAHNCRGAFCSGHIRVRANRVVITSSARAESGERRTVRRSEM